MQNIAAFIDHTALQPSVTEREIVQLCAEARQYGFKTVCVPPLYARLAMEQLQGSTPKVSTVIGFPLGYQSLRTKMTETEEVLQHGAAEVDVVMNVSAFKSGKYALVEGELRNLMEKAHSGGVLVKVIIETAYLDGEEVRKACELCTVAGADFVKTSTGFAPQGAQLEQVIQMRKWLPETVKIKASGGIKDYEQAKSFIQAGADRLGTSSGVQIVKGAFAKPTDQPL